MAGSKAGTPRRRRRLAVLQHRLREVEPQLRRRRLVHVHVGVERAERDGHGRVRAGLPWRLEGSRDLEVARGGSEGEKREQNSGTHHGSMIPADDARPG